MNVVSFARTDARGEIIPHSSSCRAKTSSTKWDVTTSNREGCICRQWSSARS